MSGLSKPEKFLVILLLFAGAFLRLYQPLQYPLSINQDELNNIYDGWSFTETGKDRWEGRNPFILRGLGDGDYRPSLQAWIIGGVFKITGYSVAIGRSVNAVIALFALWLLFLFLKNSFNAATAIAGLAVASLSAWGILFSRMAHEGTVLPFFFISLILYLWQKNRVAGYNNLFPVLVLGFVIGFSANAYQSTKVSAFILCFVIAADIFFLTGKKIKLVLLVIATSVLGAFPQIYTLFTDTEQFFSRAKSQAIPFNSAESIWIVLSNIAKNFDPAYLFFSNGVHNNLSVYRLYSIEIVFFYAGFVLLLINHKKIRNGFPPLFVFITLIATVLPAALTYTNPHALRVSGMVILAPVCTAIGWFFFTGFIRQVKLKQAINSIGLIALCAFCFATASNYNSSIDLRNRNQQHYLVNLYGKLNPIKNNYLKIYIENTTGESYLYLISFCNIYPKDFQKMEKDYSKMTFDDFNRLDKYYFIKPESWQVTLSAISPREKSLIISPHKFDNFRVLDSSVFENSVFYFSEK